MEKPEAVFSADLIMWLETGKNVTCLLLIFWSYTQMYLANNKNKGICLAVRILLQGTVTMWPETSSNSIVQAYRHCLELKDKLPPCRSSLCENDHISQEVNRKTIETGPMSFWICCGSQISKICIQHNSKKWENKNQANEHSQEHSSPLDVLPIRKVQGC